MVRRRATQPSVTQTHHIVVVEALDYKNKINIITLTTMRKKVKRWK